ncbi:MAG: hypothetical protein FWC47_01780 [Oscillospiraceae bacterium]|nr:hypothetical protein [Oscillospiraceae bacterium]
MNAEHFDCVKNIINSDAIGEPKMIRIYRGLALENISKKDALSLILYEDIGFIIDILGNVDKVFARSFHLYNTIIILKHENKSLSHISVNFYDEPALETFRLEIAGTKGLTEYDSDKESTILYHRKQNISLKESTFNDINRKDVQNVILKIFDAIEKEEMV